jgi:hypothetical protein
MAAKTTAQLIAEINAASAAADASIAETNRILGISQPVVQQVVPPASQQPAGFTPAKTYEEAKALLGQITDPKTKAALGNIFSSIDAQSTKVTTMAGNIGYDVNTVTGALTPKPVTNVDSGTKLALDTKSTLTGEKIDSIAAIKALLSSYGLGDLSASITEAVQKGYSADTIQLIMQDPNSTDTLAVAFQKRFPANKIRAAAGKSVLSAGEYLAAERTYSQVLQSYGVGSLAKPETLSGFISGDISAAEVSDRVGLAINRIQNADADTKKALAEYYPMLNQTDIVSAVLNPAEGLPALQRKVQIAEIGGAALAQGIKTTSAAGTNTMGAQALADLGITKDQARQGFQQVAEVTPRGSFLSEISTSGQQYGQLQAEQEAFQGLASAKRARQALTAEEQARFGGASGLSKTSLKTQGQGLI